MRIDFLARKNCSTLHSLRPNNRLILARKLRAQEKVRLRIAAKVWWVEKRWVIVELVQRNLGWAFVPEHVVASALENGYLVSPLLEFDDHNLPIALELVWHKQRPLGKAATWLKAAVIAASQST